MMLGAAVLALIIAAGLNAPLAMCALSLAAINGSVTLRLDDGMAWIGTPWFLGFAVVMLILQLYADLYFVPITVKDWRYLNPSRTHNAYLHARLQSFLRPLCSALIVAAVLVSLPEWIAALLGFCGATAIYWLSAWIREFVARTRGVLMLMVLETMKNILLIPLVVLAFWLPLLSVALGVAMLTPTALWTTRLQREYQLYASYGGQRAREDA